MPHKRKHDAPVMGCLPSLVQQPYIVIGLPQDMVCQKRQDDGPDLAVFDPFDAGGLELSEFQRFLQRFLADHRCVVCRSGLRQQRRVLLGKGIGGTHQFVLRGIQQSADEERVFHHNLVPEDLRFLHGLSVQIAPVFRAADKGLVQLCLPDDVLQQKGVIHGEHTAAEHPVQNPLLESDQAPQQAERRLVQLFDLAAQSRGDTDRIAAAQQRFHVGDLPVDLDAGKTLCLFFRVCGEFRHKLAGGQHLPADHAAAQKDGAAQQHFKFLLVNPRFLGKIPVRRREARL